MDFDPAWGRFLVPAAGACFVVWVLFRRFPFFAHYYGLRIVAVFAPSRLRRAHGYCDGPTCVLGFGHEEEGEGSAWEWARIVYPKTPTSALALDQEGAFTVDFRIGPMGRVTSFSVDDPWPSRIIASAFGQETRAWRFRLKEGAVAPHEERRRIRFVLLIADMTTERPWVGPLSHLNAAVGKARTFPKRGRRAN